MLTRWLFLRTLGVVYCIAFASLGVQVLELVGSRGILPAAEFLAAVKASLGAEAYLALPTLGWLSASDGFLLFLCWGGAALSVLVVLRVAPAAVLAVLWVFYLSLYGLGQTFLAFQWDLLLLEAGLLGVFLAPWQLRPRLVAEPEPPLVAVWLVRWLVFRLMFLSGVVKLLDESPAAPTWKMLTALTYHYETQCLPTAIAWYAHQLPPWFQKASVLGVFAIEIAVPFLIFTSRRLRLAAFFPLVFLQLLIAWTGNYNFFNLLSIALCLMLLDDGCVRPLAPAAAARDARLPAPRPPAARLHRSLTAAFAAVVLVVGGLWLAAAFLGFRALPESGKAVLRYSSRFSSINTYGLFRSMTTSRPEIVVEGSDDGRTWREYGFRWKPGDVARRPGRVAPHQPRLDWQMWFAALGSYQSPRDRWFASFLHRLLEGEPEVLALLAPSPFPERPPRLIRAVLYDYRFTTPAERRESGAWWTRTRLGPYSPLLSTGSRGGREVESSAKKAGRGGSEATRPPFGTSGVSAE
ncbi:MAG: lipase maturation factor family protein [Acidobacteriota bacterium]|nr:lipase maturation factor family protein [Acidobacteriota bacterium]